MYKKTWDFYLSHEVIYVMKRDLLIIDSHPFGRLTDSYKWCQYLRDKYEISFICLDDGSNIAMGGVNIIRVKRYKNKQLRGAIFFLSCLFHVYFSKGPIVIVYFEHCSLIKRLAPWKNIHVDVRTVAVWGNQTVKDKYDSHLRSECLLFDSVSVISEGVRDRLQLVNASILPLGGESISPSTKSYNNLRLLYVGTLTGRRIEDTIKGLRLFLDNYNSCKDIQYNIIGDGHFGELEALKELVDSLNLQDYVHLLGRIDYNDLGRYFNNSNIGVCYVPITPSYDLQPSTKIFEYSLSGLFTIATGTKENKRIIDLENGIIINDTPDDFCRALFYVEEHNCYFNEQRIRECLNGFTWCNIVNNYLQPLLKAFC